MKNINFINIANIRNSINSVFFNHHSFLALFFFLVFFSPILLGTNNAMALTTGCSGDGTLGTTDQVANGLSEDVDCTTFSTADTCIDDGCLWTVSTTGSAGSNAFVNVTCRVMKIATGPAGKTVGAIAIISTGIGFFFGKTSWGLLITVGLGVGTIFGSATIVGAITGEAVFDCTFS